MNKLFNPSQAASLAASITSVTIPTRDGNIEAAGNWPAAATHAIQTPGRTPVYFLGSVDAAAHRAALPLNEREISRLYIWDWGPQQVDLLQWLKEVE